jgi:hypothetical protein
LIIVLSQCRVAPLLDPMIAEKGISRPPSGSPGRGSRLARRMMPENQLAESTGREPSGFAWSGV